MGKTLGTGDLLGREGSGGVVMKLTECLLRTSGKEEEESVQDRLGEVGAEEWIEGLILFMENDYEVRVFFLWGRLLCRVGIGVERSWVCRYSCNSSGEVRVRSSSSIHSLSSWG